MLTFFPEAVCAVPERTDQSFTGDVALGGDGVWAGLVSSGRCAVGGSLPAGPGDFFLAASPLILSAPAACHAVAARLDGAAAEVLRPPAPRVLPGTSCPRCGETLSLLLAGEHSPGRVSALAYALLCDLCEAEEAKPLPPLAVEAVSHMREDYATLYGVEDLADALGVSKSHLIRVFSAALGVTPGQYLTSVRLDAAKELLLLREYSLEAIAGLCGFSGSNYFCRVFRRREGTTPGAWLAASGARTVPRHPHPAL